MKTKDFPGYLKYGICIDFSVTLEMFPEVFNDMTDEEAIEWFKSEEVHNSFIEESGSYEDLSHEEYKALIESVRKNLSDCFKMH